MALFSIKLSGLTEADFFKVTIMHSISQQKWVSATLTWAGLKSKGKALGPERKHLHNCVDKLQTTLLALTCAVEDRAPLMWIFLSSRTSVGHHPTKEGEYQATEPDNANACRFGPFFYYMRVYFCFLQ